MRGTSPNPLPCRNFSAVRPFGMHEAGCAGRRGSCSWTESHTVRTAVRACSCSAGRGPSLAGCKVAGNALHDRPWAWPGRALQSRVSCAASCKQSSCPFHSSSVLDRGCLKEGEHCSSHARATRKSLTISWPKWRHEMAWQILRGHYHDLCRLQRGSTAHPALQRSAWPRPRPVVERVTGDFAASE